MKKSIIISIILVLVILFAGCFAFINKKFIILQSNKDAQRIYKQGLVALKENDLQNAYYNFSKISQFNALYEAALFRQGMIAIELKDYNSAIKSYATLLEKFPNTIFAERAIYELAIAYYNTGFKERAYANFKLITQKYEKSDFADASKYFLGMLATENNKEDAIELLSEYLEKAPNGKYSLLAVKELQKHKTDLSDEDIFNIAVSLFENEKYQESLEYFSNLHKPEKTWAYIAYVYAKKGNRAYVQKVFNEGITKYTKNDSKIQKRIVDYFVGTTNRTKNLKSLKVLCDKSKCQLNDYIMYNLLGAVDNKTKKEYYNTIYTMFSDGDYAADALFNSMFYDYIDKNYENAIIKAKKHIANYDDKISAPAAMYWLARTYEKKNNTSEANSYYNKLIVKYGDSYYAYLAATKLNGVKNPYEVVNFVKVPEEKINIEFPILHAKLPINASKKIDVLINVGDFKIFENADINNKIIQSWVAYYEGDLAKSAYIAQKVLDEADTKPNFDDELYKLVYPIGYAKEINTYSGQKNNISPVLLLSLIKKESYFKADAKSVSGAIGLTQIMPDTAAFISSKYGIRYNRAALPNPDYNIKLGSAYYRYIKQLHNNHDVYAVASYNSGHNAVEKWIKEFGAKDFDEFVEMIPYQETRNYVKLVYQNVWAYYRIYNLFDKK